MEVFDKSDLKQDIFEVTVTHKKLCQTRILPTKQSFNKETGFLENEVAGDPVSSLEYNILSQHKQETTEGKAYEIVAILNDKNNSKTNPSFAKAVDFKMVCGDPQTIQVRINEMLPMWRMDGNLVWDGKIFWQKMVKYNAF